MNEVKEAIIEINDIKLKVAIVNGLGNAKEILKIIKQDPSRYDYIEVMACPGGCIGGGGQPLPTTQEIRKLRAQGLYNIDEIKNNRLADESPIIKKIYQEFLTNQEIRHKICHTHYSIKQKENN